MEFLAIFTTAFIVGFSGAMMPGPLLTITIGESARRGFTAGPLITLGHGILEIALILALAGGLSEFLTQSIVSYTIAILGGAFLIYMGFEIVRDAVTGKASLNVLQPESKSDGSETKIPGMSKTLTENVCSDRGRNMHPVVAGILVSVSNPYWILWWATVGLGYITVSLRSGLIGLASFFTGHILADLVWYSLVSAAIAGGRRFFSNGIYKGILIASGIFLIGLGGYFIYYSLIT
ncbi:MAG: leucine export protein LeuE [Pelotomaculum sp. PtaU1.Bin035]|nr:MAG: leucine export protein LeuE [Pelotomaculum sp. PtaU1.Bin035]